MIEEIWASNESIVLESTSAALGPPHLYPTQCAVVDTTDRAIMPRHSFLFSFFFFWIHANSCWIGPNRIILTETGWIRLKFRPVLVNYGWSINFSRHWYNIMFTLLSILYKLNASCTDPITAGFHHVDSRWNDPRPWLSSPKPNTRICDHDQHANIKLKLDINKNQLNFYKIFTKASPFISFLFFYFLR